MSNTPRNTTIISTHEEMLRTSGYDIGSPISGSMRPMIRQQRDSVVFVLPKGRLKKYDVALYRRDGQTIMHRVIRVRRDGYIIRGDNTYVKEHVADSQIIGVMQGFYRDETYIPAEDLRYRLYARAVVLLHPFLPLFSRIARLLRRSR